MPRTRLAAWLVALAMWLGAAVAHADPPLASATHDGGTDGRAPESAPARGEEQEEVEALRTLAGRIRAFMAESLEPSVDVATLFDRPLDDEDGIRVEVERLRAIVARAASDDDTAADAGAAATRPPGTPKARKAGSSSKRPASGRAADAGADAGIALAELDPDLWRAQLAVDRARLAFYELPKARRAALVEKHAERQKADREAQAKRGLSEAENKAGEAELERQRALEEARRARTEAARMVAEEHARLLGVKKRQAEFEAELIERELALDRRQEEALRLRRQVREGIEARRSGGSVAAADALYDELRSALRPAREALREATEALVAPSSVPVAGEDQLLALPADVDRKAAVAARRLVESSAEHLAEREERFRYARARKIADEVTVLNSDRLALLAFVTPSKRNAVTGFGPRGLDQAASEVRQVVVVLGYHLTATLHWLAEMRAPDASRGRSALTGLLIALRWVIPIAVFVWWRRRAEGVLSELRESIRENDKKARPRAVTPSWAERMVAFAERVRSPLEWLVLLWAVVWLLPPAAAGLLEVRLLSTVFVWVLGGAIAVQVIDFASGVESERRIRRSRLQTAHLRLRSLRLVSHVVVAFGLVLDLSSQLVGKGTIYGWVWSFCWVAAIPVVLVLVRWWRPVIFERIERTRKKTAVERWITANATGWTSFPAALLGGAVLLWNGIYRTARSRLSTFTISRRVLAYLFRREIDKRADQQSKIAYEGLDERAFATLGPQTPSSEIVPSVADAQVKEVIRRINLPGGGVFAIVGERGAGKTTLLRQIQAGAFTAHVIDCPFGGMEAFAPAFLAAFGAGSNEKLEDVAARADAAGRDSGILVDDAHRLIQPKMGGLRAFDRVLAIARTHSAHVCWVFAFDDVIWRFFERMRGAKPLFDEVIRIEAWEEEAIARLLRERTTEAGIDPDFSGLLPELPADSDEIDREEALDRTEASYYRLIWDYAGGNPGVALQAWRSALGVRPDGSVSVKIFQPPPVAELEQLPDNAVFVLRALVQLEHADLGDLSAATGIGGAQVGDAIRFGLVRGYVRIMPSGEYAVSWIWFRSITRFLQRRHLLFAD